MITDAWSRLAGARVARLATVAPAGEPRLVPICFALDEGTLYSIVDDKPKRSPRLQRLRDVRSRPFATVLVDRYDEDWTRLWWVRAGGPARVVERDEDPPVHDRAAALLLGRYVQYVEHALDGPVLAVELLRWRSWAAGSGAV